MPKSRVRKKKTELYTPPPTVGPRKRKPSPLWFGILVLALMLIGVAWLVVYYTTQGQLPISKISAWNVVVGFGFIALGFGLATQWR